MRQANSPNREIFRQNEILFAFGDRQREPCKPDLWKAIDCRQINRVLPKVWAPMCTAKVYREMDEYWRKNRQLDRPLSPHLSIYKPQLTSMLSLCHRVTGIAMVVAITGTSIALLCLPGDFPTYLTMVKDLQLGSVIITAAKYILAFPICYHFINGIRHLAWDWALGFGLQFLYKTGWFVFALAWVVASLFVFCLPLSKEQK